jgi:predicted SprT family Zn-dependent metalloprotease
MSRNSEIDQAIQNLSAIKDGRPIDEADTPGGGKSRKGLQSDDALEVAHAEVDRLYEKHDDLAETLPRCKLWVGVSRSNGRNGVCKWNTRLTKQRFNKQITQTESKYGEFSIVINEKILEQGNRDEFIDTVRHEVAHAIAYESYNKYPSRERDANYEAKFKPHGKAWKEIASKIGADPSSCHSKRDRSDEYKYYIGCPSCGMTVGRTKRSKIIKKPFHRKCNKCGEHSLVSYDAGDEMPDENGTVAVESIPWDNEAEYFSHQRE